MADSQVTVVGNATREPEIKFTPSGASITSFGIAVNRRWPNKQGEWQEETSFFDVKCWGDLGENVAESVAKGTRVVVTGRLEQHSWEADNGDKRSKVEIVADEVAPSLRWATATVNRTERREGQSGGSAPRPAQAQRPQQAPAPAWDSSTEPF